MVSYSSAGSAVAEHPAPCLPECHTTAPPPEFSVTCNAGHPFISTKLAGVKSQVGIFVYEDICSLLEHHCTF